MSPNYWKRRRAKLLERSRKGVLARLWVEVDGRAHKPRSWRGLMRVVCKRVVGNKKENQI
jgi:hypothetical protein